MRVLPRLPLFCGLLLPLAGGCGGDADVGYVSGRVTLDGKPLPNATVVFAPKDGGRNSVGVTDEDGDYVLKYTSSLDGAKVGTHTVRVTTGVEEDGKVTAPERVPIQYNRRSELLKEVEPGSNTIDIELKSGGPVLQPNVPLPEERFEDLSC